MIIKSIHVNIFIVKLIIVNISYLFLSYMYYILSLIDDLQCYLTVHQAECKFSIYLKNTQVNTYYFVLFS